MTSKYILCFAVLIAAIEAYPKPQYVAVPIAEYEALLNGQPEAQSHSFRVAASTPLSRHKRSSTQFTPMAPRPQRPYRQQVDPRPTYNHYYDPQQFEASSFNEVAVEPEYVPVHRFDEGYKQQYNPQQFESSHINKVVVDPKYAPVHRFAGQYKQQNRRKQYAASVINAVAVKPERLPAVYPNNVGYRPRTQQYEVEPERLSALRPFTGGYDGTPQYSPNQVVYVEEDPSGEYSADLDQGASATHEKRDAGYGASGDDHVDYGAYTGSHGAFGWYSDHPVLLHR